jgi:hypothetical protein
VRFLGPSTRDISANDLMREFFQRHPLKEGRRWQVVPAFRPWSCGRASAVKIRMGRFF